MALRDQSVQDQPARDARVRVVGGARWFLRGLAALAAVGCLAAVPSLAAQELSYSWVEMEVGARDSERLLRFDDGGATATLDAGVAAGIGIAGSFELGRRLYLTGRFREFRSKDVEATLRSDGVAVRGFDDVRAEQARIALGLRWRRHESFELFTEVGAERALLRFDRQLALELPDGDAVTLPRRAFDETAADLRVGLRKRLSRKFELLAALHATSLQVGQLEVNSDGDLQPRSDLLGELALIFYPTPRVGLQLRYEGGRTDEAVASLRWVF